MKHVMVFSWEFYNKVLELAEFLEENSKLVLNHLRKMPLFDEEDEMKYSNYRIALREILATSQKLKKELITAATKQKDMLHDFESFKTKFTAIGENMKRFQVISSNISDPMYYINEKGKLVNNNIS